MTQTSYGQVGLQKLNITSLVINYNIYIT